jgi:glycosyltransferase involved in cell wall biosynthesis
MPSSNLPPSSTPKSDIDATTTGSFVVDEIMNVERRERSLVSIVLPAYEEASILHDHVVELLGYLKTLSPRFRFEVIIVNDGSRDQTGAIATQLAAEFDGVRVFHHPRNFGLGQALKTGFAQCRGQYVVVLDIDLSYGPEHVGLLLDRITQTGARMVLASPYMRGGRVVDVPWLRVVFSRVANWFLARASGQRISTMTCMVRAIDGRFLRSLHLRSTGMDVMPEMIHKAKLLRASIEEVPAELNWERQNRVGSRRRTSLRIIRQILGTTVSGFILRPFTFLLVPGLLLIAFAAYVNTWMVIHFVEAYVEIGAAPAAANDMSAAVALAYARYPHTFIVGLLSLMLSMQLIGMAMLSLQNKKYFDELFHLGSTVLRERREADLRRKDEAEPPEVISPRQAGDRPRTP